MSSSTILDEQIETTMPIQQETTTSIPPETTAIQSDMTTAVNDLFSQNNIIYFIWFLGIYLIVYYIIGRFFNNTVIQSSFIMALSWSIDLIFLVVLIFVFISIYNVYINNQNLPLDLYNKLYDFISNPNSIIITGLFILSFYIVVNLFRIPNQPDTKPYSISLIENMAWIFFIFILIWDFFKYILKISLFDLFPFLNLTPSPPEKDEPAPVVEQKEVFNVGNNLYTYEDAREVCSIYNAELATYDQIEKAYNNGAEWCNYGWSANQLALFPTQKETWAKLQSYGTEIGKSAYVNHGNDCGRPGINGGYIANPYVKFGVNCYGVKPRPTEDDLERMKTKQTRIVPGSINNEEKNSKLKYWKDNKDKLLQINSYNLEKWTKTE